MRYAIVTSNLGDCADPHAAVRLARTVEAAGWEAYFVWECLGFVRRVPDVPLMYGARAERTEG